MESFVIIDFNEFCNNELVLSRDCYDYHVTYDLCDELVKIDGTYQNLVRFIANLEYDHNWDVFDLINRIIVK